MNAQEIQAWVQAAAILIPAGQATVATIFALIGQWRGETLTEEEQNAILEGVKKDAIFRQWLALQDAGGDSPDTPIQ